MPEPHPDPAPPADRTPVADPGLVLLPHTGIRAPHDRFTVCDLRHHLTGTAIAYAATLCLDGEPVGRISNPRGTTTVYRGTSACTPADLAAYAAACLDPHGEPISLGELLDDLLDESETAATVAELNAQRLTPVRLVRPVGDQNLHHVPVGIRASAEPHTWAVLGPALHRQRPLHEGEVYEIWHAGTWHRLPPPDPADPARA